MLEKKLIEGCCKKDRKAQRELFATFYKPVFRVVKRYMSDFHESEDVTIVVFNKVFDKVDNFQYRGEGSLRRWINTIAINESIRAIKKVRNLYSHSEPIDEVPVIETESAIDVEKVNLILAKMPRGYRTVFNLYAIDGFSHSEIAEALNISRNTSKSQLLKARKFIIGELENESAYGT